jgi:uncharacterized protein (DUF2147 family)
MKTLTTLAGAALLLAAAAAGAQPTPIGLWKTIDDETRQEKSFVRIVESAGVLAGTIEKLLDPGKQDSRCDKCSDARKGQKVLGMTLLEGVSKAAGEDHWDGGTILDPNNGKVYKVRLTPKDGGKALDVRGYIGAPLLGRTQTWIRVD